MTHRPPSPRPAWLVTALTLAVFVVLDTYDWALFRALAAETEGWVEVGMIGLLRWLPQVLAPLALAAALAGPSRALETVGLHRSPVRGFALALAVTSLLVMIYAVAGQLTLSEEKLESLVNLAVFSGFAEEVWYRAFLFGFLYRLAGWGFLPAALLVAVVFGAAHLSQGGSPAEAAGIFAITGIGGFWFAWLYAEWEFDLWVPVGFHVLMNAWWIVFDVADTALGPVEATVARLAVVAIAVGATLAMARRRGGRLVRGRRWVRGRTSWPGPGGVDDGRTRDPTRHASGPNT